MRSESPRFRRHEPNEFGFPSSRYDFQSADEKNANSAHEVIGEMALVLVVILGIIVAITVVLASLHIS
ncbi:MAG TPA: hypothetical protein VHT03_09565 [Rhizomicrobium sp.]|jgi:hypothetical protein|nr:hypothetical protein [Rhizomicrobium sp.]